MQGGVLEVVGLFLRQEEVRLLKRQVMFLKTPIKIRKPHDTKAVHDTEISSARTAQRTTELIVKNWIIESRERRRLVLNRLQDAIRRKDI